jgi:hypothetical protein
MPKQAMMMWVPSESAICWRAYKRSGWVDAKTPVTM